MIAELKRRFIDANRSPECAFEVPDAKSFYDEYHDTVRGFVDENPRRDRRAWSPGQPEILCGGHTVRTYGSSEPNGVDAIQIEIAASHRNDPAKREVLNDVLAHAVSSLAARYADMYTLGAFQSANLFGGAVAQIVTGQIQRRLTSNDARLGLGGDARNRGRVKIRHHPDSVAEGAMPRRADVRVPYDENGKDYYLWVDTHGTLRISSLDHGESSEAGTPVG